MMDLILDQAFGKPLSSRCVNLTRSPSLNNLDVFFGILYQADMEGHVAAECPDPPEQLAGPFAGYCQTA